MNNTLSPLSAPISPTDATPLPPPASRDIRQAAKDFEALLFAQVLKTAREGNGGGWLGGGDDQAGTTMVEVAEEHLAKTLASGPGLGLGQLLLSRLASGSPAAGQPAPQGVPGPTQTAAQPLPNSVSSSPPTG